MQVGIPKEIAPGELRVAAVPETVKRMVSSGLVVAVETGAGVGANFSDDAYRQAGATIEPSASAVFAGADILLKVQRPMDSPSLGGHEADAVKNGATLIAFLWPLQNPALARRLAVRGITVFSMDAIPRITRAQPMDALSSQANIAGYRAVLIAAQHLGKMMPMMVTAAGTITAAKAFVIGAGVAGLQAIATAKRLGAVVTAFDTRPVVQEQVQSLGAKFLGIDLSKEQAEGGGGYAKQLDDAILKKEQDLLGAQAKVSDFVVTTAQIPGKPAPKLLTADAVRAMAPGSVIVDLAAEQGGNCELTRVNETVVEYGVTIVGRLNLPSDLAQTSSVLYSKNVWSFLQLLWKKNVFNVDRTDEVVNGTLIAIGGEIVHAATQKALAAAGAPR